MDISNHLSFFAALYRVEDNPKLGMWLLYLTILTFCIIVFKLGFAKKLPLLKTVMIYLFLFFGSTLLCFLGIFLPVGEGLVVASLILIIYKIRLHKQKNKEVKDRSYI